jgi:hypothetical protein
MFPYTKGMVFQHEVFLKLDQAAFTEVFKRAPSGTNEILHPEKYLAGGKPVRPALPPVEGQRDYGELADGDVGEFDHSILLRQYAGEEVSKALAPEWRGGYFKLLESKRDKRLVLAYASEWSTPEAARRYFDNYRKVLAGKWKNMQVTDETPGALSGRGDDGRFSMRLEGTRVTSVEGLP